MDMNDSSANFPAQKHRKPNRLSRYDYASSGSYFITICTANHEPLFGRIRACEDSVVSAKMVLNEKGHTVEAAILAIPEHYPGTAVDQYVVMPNHIHLILTIPFQSEKSSSVPNIIGQFKRAVSIQLGKSIWQQGFHDHIIRGEMDYREIWSYIDNNPLKWALDKYYRECP